ncbi:hypothetical protein KUCAC02_015566 [Chaenocephalus aceratus]|uniref:Uncharacterized protein n=1 Tax=Chaenocephalus aceratus TaxID=36190 RepID=A0ACB9XZF2_CHAAC|nr:hypothetical protein KUCAC02_015566 [Chaenocephalus aceratus]
MCPSLGSAEEILKHSKEEISSLVDFFFNKSRKLQRTNARKNPNWRLCHLLCPSCKMDLSSAPLPQVYYFPLNVLLLICFLLCRFLGA